jgi:DNA-binding HxlR family transcriptional regulator
MCCVFEGRWKLVILFHLFGGHVRRFSELRRAIPAVSEKMLIQQLRQMERDGVVRRSSDCHRISTYTASSKSACFMLGTDLSSAVKPQRSESRLRHE